MKKLIFLLFFIPAVCSGQAIYLNFQPADLGIGLRGDYYIGQYGFYSSASYGDWGLYRQVNLRHHYKFTQGVLIPLKDYKGCSYNVLVGANYHIFDRTSDEPLLNPIVLEHWSFELGLTVYIGRIAIGARTDLRRWEPCVDFGITFNKRKAGCVL